MANSGDPGHQSSLLFFHKIHCETMCIDIDIYLTPSGEHDLPGHHTTHSIAGPRLIVML